MSKLPRNVKGKQLIAVLEKLGFKVVGKRGGHFRLSPSLEDGHRLQYIQNQFLKAH